MLLGESPYTVVNAHRSGQAGQRGRAGAPASTLAHRARRTYGFAVIDDADVPRLVRRVRLRWDATRNAHVLLFPEGVLMLNPAAAEVLTLIRAARDAVFARFGVALEPEVHAAGAWGSDWPLPPAAAARAPAPGAQP